MLKIILVSILVLISVFAAISIYFVVIEASGYNVDCSKQGLVNFLGFFSEFKTLYAATIAVFSVCYWTIQMESIIKSNQNIEESKRNLKKDNALKESRYFHTDVQRKVREFFKKVKTADSSLFDYSWDMTDFDYKSAGNQSAEWNKKYDALDSDIVANGFIIILEFESLAAHVLNGEIDKTMAFKLFGKPYCKQVEVLYPFIACSRKGDVKIDYLTNLVDLYREWSIKIPVELDSVD